VNNRRAAVVGLVALAAVFVVVGIVYFTRTANELPSLLPGHEAGSTKRHVKHGVAMIGLAMVALVGAWMLSGSAHERT
jgi:hypothetical protein